MTYRPDIDGLRAIAVLLVVFFHITGYGGGFVGVDIFFVISGFLITGIIFRDIDNKKFSIADFYERRAKRILPALFVVMLTTIVIFSAFSVPIDFKALGQSTVATALFSSNFYFFFKNDYFDPASELAPLLHTWSLAVEEQYYIIFPLIAAACAALSRRKRLLVLTTIFLLSFVSAAIIVRISTNAAFYIPIPRFYEILVGAILAVAVDTHKPSAIAASISGLFGVAIILGTATFFYPEMLFPGEIALVPCLGAAALLYAGKNENAISTRLLSIKPLRFVGQISYSLYLWHWPVLVCARYVLFRDLTISEQIASFVLMMVLATLSWRFVERPTRGLHLRRDYIFAAAACGIVVSVIAGGLIHLTSGLPTRLSPTAQLYANAALDINPRRQECDRPSIERIAAGKSCVVGDTSVQNPTVAFIGDSFGDAMMPGISAALAKENLAAYGIIRSGCVPLYGTHQDGGCEDFVNAAVDFAASDAQISTVILVGRWTSAFHGTRFGQYRGDKWFITDAQTVVPSYAENHLVFARSFDRMLSKLSGKNVIIVAYMPEQRYNIPRALALNSAYGIPSAISVPRGLFDDRQQPLRDVFNQLKNNHQFSLVDLGATLCDTQDCRVTDGNTVLYADDNHLSRSGSLLLMPEFAAAFQGAAPYSLSHK